MVNLLEDYTSIISPTLQGHKDGDVKLDDILSLRIVAGTLPFVFPRDDVV